MQLRLCDNTSTWVRTRDGDIDAFRLFRRHYSYREYADGRRADKSNPNRHLFVGPGGKHVLITPELDALFVWRKFKDDSGQVGVNNAVFRNESPRLASELIREAERIAWDRWPRQRLYTFIKADKIKSTNPGYCYQMAGWVKWGETKNGTLVFEKEPFFRRRRMSDLQEHDLTVEEWREYDIPGREMPYLIGNPQRLYCRPGGSTHRVVDSEGITHCVPAPGIEGCVLRWKSKDASKPVAF